MSTSPFQRPGAPSEFPPVWVTRLLGPLITSAIPQHASGVGPGAGGWGSALHRAALLGTVCQDPDVARCAQGTPQGDYKGALSNVALAQGQEQRAQPRSRRAWVRPFPSWDEFPICRGSACSGFHFRKATREARSLSPDLTRVHTERGRKRPNGQECLTRGFQMYTVS